ncbi:MAG: hypothetical protein M1826_002678 [Phylliscum demangeonii]|nr:MAG: hypothetical protein M1826_002678 [Phylliscum demangeonii]
MSLMDEDKEDHSQTPSEYLSLPRRLPFKPISRSHILHCSYDYWHKLYRSITPKARIIPLSAGLVNYLREDGIVLPPDDDDDDDASRLPSTWTDQDSGVFSYDDSSTGGAASDSDSEAPVDPSANFRDIHRHIRDTIAELGGSVAPKLNWSAPKDAAWIAATNSLECRSPNDVYLLFKSSDFITHDLEHAFDECEDEGEEEERKIKEKDEREGEEEEEEEEEEERKIKEKGEEQKDGAATARRSDRGDQAIDYVLVLRKWVEINPSVEFRCFVRARSLLAICQRDLNHFDFLFAMRDHLRAEILTFFHTRIQHTFPDEDFVFDVYVPPPHKRVWLIDVNPWAPRTDPLLFSWLELLQMDDGAAATSRSEEDRAAASFVPELRLVKRDDPEAYSFNTPQFSAHKLPREVVEASAAGPGPLRQFADRWKEMMAGDDGQAHGAESDSN